MERDMFKFYKNRIIEERNEFCRNNIRFNGIQFLCSAPGLCPVEMAASLMMDGYQILFDDSSISKGENNKNRHTVERFVKSLDSSEKMNVKE